MKHETVSHSAETGPTSQRGREYRTVQALRFVAAFAVVCLHSSFYTTERLDPKLGLYTLGAHGVRLFFVISGFVMIVSSERLARATQGWRVFLAKRIVRIVPLYWLVTAIKTAALFATPSLVLHTGLDWEHIVKSYLFIPAMNRDGAIDPLLGVGWTLNFEMAFYLLFTLALLLRLPPVRALAPVLVGFAALSLVRTRDWPVPLYFWADPIVLDFLAGMLIARWAQAGRKLATGAGTVVGVAGLAWLFLPSWQGIVHGLASDVGVTIAATAVLAGSVSLEPGLGERVPRFVMFMGAASYSLYLIHPLTAPAAPQLFAKLHLVQPLLAILAGIAIAFLAGALCYRFVETPLSRVTEGLARRRGLLDARDQHQRAPAPTGALP